MSKKPEAEVIEVGAKVLVTEKDGTTTEAIFVSAKAGWTNVTVKGEARKVRTKDVAVKMTKAEAKKLEAAARRAEKAAAKANVLDLADGEGRDRLVPADLAHYVLHETKTASGRKHIDVDDDTAAKLRTLDLPGTYKYAATVLGESVKELTAKYQHLNNGMQRMNLGNRVRKAMKAGVDVQAGMAEKKARSRRVKEVEPELEAEPA